MSRFWVDTGYSDFGEDQIQQEKYNKEIEEIALKYDGQFRVQEFGATFITESAKEANAFMERVRKLMKEYGWATDGMGIAIQPECPKCGRFGKFSDNFCGACGSELNNSPGKWDSVVK